MSVDVVSQLRCLVYVRDEDADDAVAASDIVVLVLLGGRGSRRSSWLVLLHRRRTAIDRHTSFTLARHDALPVFCLSQCRTPPSAYHASSTTRALREWRA